MKTLADVVRRVQFEVDHFQMRHRGQVAQGYLWFHPTTAEQDGGFMAAEEQPAPGYEPVTPESFRQFTGADFAQRLRALGILGRLPVLAREIVAH